MTVTHKWVAGAVALALALLAGSWFLLIAPKRSEAADLQSQVDGQLDANAVLQTDIERLKEQKKDLPKQQARLADLRTDVPQTAAIPPLIRELNAAADRSGVVVTSLSPSTAAPVLADAGSATEVEGVLTPGGLAGIENEIIVEGSYFDILKFVNELESLDRYMLVTTLNIVEADPEATDEALSTSDATTPLIATIGGRVFLLPEAAEVDATAVEPTTADPATSSQ